MSFYIETEFYKTREYTPGVFSILVLSCISIMFVSALVYLAFIVARSEYTKQARIAEIKAEIASLEENLKSLDAENLAIHEDIEEMIDETRYY